MPGYNCDTVNYRVRVEPRVATSATAGSSYGCKSPSNYYRASPSLLMAQNPNPRPTDVISVARPKHPGYSALSTTDRELQWTIIDPRCRS
eukprot:1447363-Amphidinium_carterae.2